MVMPFVKKYKFENILMSPMASNYIDISFFSLSLIYRRENVTD